MTAIPIVTRFQGDIRRVALARLDHIGDFLLWLPTAQFYRAFFANAEIVLFVNDRLRDLASVTAFWDRAVPVYDGATPTAALMPREEFDFAINLQYSRSSAHDLFMARIRARRSIAVDAESPNMTADELTAGNALYSDLLHVDPAPRHELVRNFQILDTVTGTRHTPCLTSLEPFLAPVQDLPARYVAVFPGSAWFKKTYPWPRLVAICRMLEQRFGLTCVLCGSSADLIVADNIERNAPRAIINLTGQLQLRQSLGVISGATLVIANDAMAAHAANLLGVRSVCILGSGYNWSAALNRPPLGRFFPYPADLVPAQLQTVLRYPMSCEGCSYHCRYDSLARDCIPCVDYIPLPSVTDAVVDAITRGAAGCTPGTKRATPRVAAADGQQGHSAS